MHDWCGFKPVSEFVFKSASFAFLLTPHTYAIIMITFLNIGMCLLLYSKYRNKIRNSMNVHTCTKYKNGYTHGSILTDATRITAIIMTSTITVRLHTYTYIIKLVHALNDAYKHNNDTQISINFISSCISII